MLTITCLVSFQSLEIDATNWLWGFNGFVA
jgi:hypothetical protein